MPTHPLISEGAALYVLGLVVIAADHDRFWFGFALAAVPILIGATLKAFTPTRPSRRS
jgi:hypothetical protein